MLAAMRLLRKEHFLSPGSLLRVYYAQIRPILEYGSLSWRGLSPTCSRRLEAVQQRALSITCLNITQSKAKSLEERRRTSLLKLFNRLQLNDMPDHLVIINCCDWPAAATASSKKKLQNSNAIRPPKPITLNLLIFFIFF